MFSKVLFALTLLLFKNKSNAQTDKQYASIPEIFYHDNYDNCMLRGDEALYCFLKYALEPVNKDNPPETWNIIKNLSAIETNYRHDHLKHYICVPKTCPGLNTSDENDPKFIKDLEDCYNEKFKEIKLKGTITEIYCQRQDFKSPVDWIDIICGAAFIIYLVFVVYATYYEIDAGHRNPEDYQKLTSSSKGKILSAFSVRKNWIRLKTVKSTPEVEKFRSIQSIRFINSAIVVMAHTLLGFVVSPISNTRYTEKIFGGSPTIILFGIGHLCLATFFLISSFLLSNGLFTYMKDKNGLSIKKCFWFFAYRSFRLFPILIFTILFHATWLRHLGEGPLWNTILEREYKNCRKNGWTNLLFINNMVDSGNMCLPTSWFMALNTQYLILSLLFIWLLKKYEKYIWYIVGVAALSNILGTFLQNYYYDFPALIISPLETYFGFKNFAKSNEFISHMGSFIGNMAGQIVGIALGYYFSKHQSEKPDEKIFNSKFRIIIFRTMGAIEVSCLVVPGIVMLGYSNVHDAFWASVYIALSRPIFSLAVGTLIIGFAEGAGRLSLLVCHWPPFYVLGRLTYSVYLVHMSIIMFRPAQARYSSYISPITMTTRFFGDLMTSYFVATLLTLLIELPVSALQKIIFVQREDSKEGRNELIKNE